MATNPIILLDLYKNNQAAIDETVSDVSNLVQQLATNGSLSPLGAWPRTHTQS